MRYYVTHMEEVFEMNTDQYAKFLRSVGNGKYVHYALTNAGAKLLGVTRRVTGWEAHDAREELARLAELEEKPEDR